MKQQVSKVCQSFYMELLRISSVRHVLKLRLPKPLSHPWYCQVLTTVTLFCQECPNSSSKNFKRFKIVLPGSFSTHLNARMLHHSWLSCIRFQNNLISSLFHVLWCSLRNCPALLVWPASPVHPIPFIAFLGWHPHFLDSKTKEKVPRATHFFRSGPCHM